MHVDQLKPYYTWESRDTSDGASPAVAQDMTQLDSPLEDETLTDPESVIDTESSEWGMLLLLMFHQ